MATGDDSQLELQKIKQDEQALKRRNIINLSPDSSSGKLAKGVILTLHETGNTVKSLDSDLSFQAT